MLPKIRKEIPAEDDNMTNMKNKPKNKAVLLKRQWALHLSLIHI